MTVARLASRSHPSSGVTGRLGRTHVLAAALIAGGCVPLPTQPTPDGGGDTGTGGGASAVIHVAPMESMEGMPTVNSLRIRVASLRLVSDRGGPFDRTVTGLDVLDLGSSGLDVDVDALTPAQYSAVELVLDGPAPVLELDASDSRGSLPVHARIVLSSRIDLLARCDSATPIDAGDTLSIHVDLGLADAWESLSHYTLPMPAGGVVTITEASAADAVGEFIDQLQAHMHADCSVDGGSGT